MTAKKGPLRQFSLTQVQKMCLMTQYQGKLP